MSSLAAFPPLSAASTFDSSFIPLTSCSCSCATSCAASSSSLCCNNCCCASPSFLRLLLHLWLFLVSSSSSSSQRRLGQSATEWSVRCFYFLLQITLNYLVDFFETKINVRILTLGQNKVWDHVFCACSAQVLNIFIPSSKLSLRLATSSGHTSYCKRLLP